MKQNQSVREAGHPPQPRKRRGAQSNFFQKFAAVPHTVWTVLFIVAPMLN